jgi:hypothetical protein
MCLRFLYFFFLNISSILSVTTNPPTTFSVPRITARKPIINAGILTGEDWPITMMAPMMTTPWIAFAPYIRGVCNADGTFPITSTPTITERMRI